MNNDIDDGNCDGDADLSNTHHNNVVADAEIYFLNRKIESLELENQSLKIQKFGYHSICENEDIFTFYTGISKEMFDIIVDLCGVVEFEYYNGWKVECFSIKDQILITFLKLRLNLVNKDIAFRFNTSESTVSNIILTFIILLHEILFKKLMETVPSQTKNRLCLPNCFVSFQNCRMTIDCTEVACDIPHQLHHQRATFSSYKHKNTLKGLIGVAPNGVITFVSNLYPGSTSDKKIVSHCGILSLLEPGDLILADKGFLISDILPDGVSLNIPPFLTSSQFTPSEVEKTKSIARARIHVERAISRLKGFKILSHIPKSLFKKSSLVFQLCASLVNFQNPLIKEVENLFTVSPTEHNDV